MVILRTVALRELAKPPPEAVPEPTGDPKGRIGPRPRLATAPVPAVQPAAYRRDAGTLRSG
jgi:hypothetical protein